MFKFLFELAGDVVAIASAPIEVAVDITRAVTKPLADASKEVVEAVKDLTQDEVEK